MKLIVVVDMQKEFLNWQPKEIREKLVKDMHQYLQEEKAKNNCLIIGTRDTHYKNEYSTYFESKTYPMHCEFRSDNWDIVKEIKDLIDLKASKKTYAMDYYTELVNKTPSEIEIVGLTTNICVLANAIMLNTIYPKTPITIIKNLTYGTSEEERYAAFTCMKSMGMILI